MKCPDCEFDFKGVCIDPFDWKNNEGNFVCRYQEGAICTGRVKLEINEIIRQAHANAVEKGFWENGGNIGEKLMLIVTELAEGMEAVRKDNLDGVEPMSGSLCEELADAVIRICDLAGHLNLDLDAAIRNKMEFNKTRPRLHGKKF